MYIYEEIHEFHALQLWIEMNVCSPRDFFGAT